MQIDGHIQALREDLVRVAALGDEATARAADLLSVAIEASLGRQIQDVLAEAALELNAQLDAAHVEVRIAGRDPELVLVSAGFDAHEDDPLADMRVSEDGFRELATRCRSLAPLTAAVLEGGYELQTLPRLVDAALDGFTA